MQDTGPSRTYVSSSEQTLVNGIRRVAVSTSQGGMTLEDAEVCTLSGLLRRLGRTTPGIVADIHHAAAAPSISGMTLEDDEIQTLVSVLADA